MSLDVALQNAISGLRASQAQIQVISSNIANAQTPGYSEEILPQESQTTPSGGGGVVTGTIQRATNQILSNNLTAQTSTASAAATANDYYQQIDTLMGQVGSGASLSDALNSYSSAMQALATTPESSVVQSNAVAAGQGLAQELNTLASGVQSMQANISTGLTNSVATLNTALQNIASLNGQISQLQAEGQPTATLQDTRDQALNQVAQLVGVQSYTSADGTMTVVTNTGQTLVNGSAASTVAITSPGPTNNGAPQYSITIDGGPTNLVSSFNSGQIGALLQMSGTVLSGVTQQLNQFASTLNTLETSANLATTASTANVAPTHLFASTDGGTINAGTIEVNPYVANNPYLLDQDQGGNPDPGIATTLSGNLSNNVTFTAAGGLGQTTTTLSDYSAQMVGQIATAAANASSNSTYQASLQTQIEGQLSSDTGVSLDAELSNLVVYQNAYGASARVVTTLQDLYDTLMKM